MKNLLEQIIDPEEQQEFMDFIYDMCKPGQDYLLRNDILLHFDDICKEKKKGKAFAKESSVARLLNRIPEMLIFDDSILIMHRYTMAKYNFYKLSRHNRNYFEEISIKEFLKYKDEYIFRKTGQEKNLHTNSRLEIDFKPFDDYAPKMIDSKKVGNGIEFLNKHLSSSLFQYRDKWRLNLFEFIKLHKIDGTQLLINSDVHNNFTEFLSELEITIEWLETIAPDTPAKKIKGDLKRRGFEKGWGETAGRILETMKMLYDLINAPTSGALQSFISRIPMINKVAIISPHGWFGQENVLGKPDTGGQVIYILDQVRALEKHLTEIHQLAGIEMPNPKILVLTRLIPNAKDTTCNQRLEKIFQTNNSYILRVPFIDDNGQILQDWISRFDIWPYLDTFANDGEKELKSEFGGRPDLIIGNYSDGNLVASLLSDKMDVIQCTIAHALEKTKYLFSDLYWQDMEDDYHFSLHFTSDLLSMNKSDFIITSTYQEIAGTQFTLGQYESYQFFTMPGLYKVISGINLFNPKFNVVPPGVDEDHYFPYYETEKRIQGKTEYWTDRLFYDDSEDVYGYFDDPEKIPVFTMARLDKIKNITGLVEGFGKNEKLREKCNLVFGAGTIFLEESADREERNQIQTMYSLIDEYDLMGHVRWLPSINKLDTGEVYRIIADRGGVFVQPALFEAFGLTILEAMLSGLPTFGPKFGGPSEIIVDGESGFLMNTSKPELIADRIYKFVEECENNPDIWKQVSEKGIKRVLENFTWNLYSERLIKLTKVYGFWRYSEAGKEMKKLDRYCDVIYHLLFRERSKHLYSSQD